MEYTPNITFIPIFKTGSTISIIDFKIVPTVVNIQLVQEYKDD